MKMSIVDFRAAAVIGLMASAMLIGTPAYAQDAEEPTPEHVVKYCGHQKYFYYNNRKDREWFLEHRWDDKKHYHYHKYAHQHFFSSSGWKTLHVYWKRCPWHNK
jgi:hypothetical protein